MPFTSGALRVATLGVAATLLLSFLFVKTQAADPARFQRLSDEIRHLEELHIDLDQEVLDARYSQLRSYDPLVKTMAEIRRRGDDVQGALTAEDDAEVRRRIEALVELSRRKQDVVEDFKSENAILRNAIGYFPIAADTSIGEAEGNGAPYALQRPMNALVRDMLLFGLRPSADLAASAERRIEGLAAVEADVPEVARRSFGQTLAQARAILRHGRAADDLVRGSGALNGGAACSELFDAYRAHRERRLAAANTYRLLLYAVSVALLAAVAFTLVRLRRTAGELREAVASLDGKRREVEAMNADLEGRVLSRTAELAEANRGLVAANASKSEFLANMSHEIRTPMTAVQGYADLLLDPELGAADRTAHVETIRRNGAHLLAILDDILDLSKIEAGRMAVEAIPTSPAQILFDLGALMSVRAVEKGLDFSIEYLTPIPATVRTDPTRLRQILMNLAGNALKFTRTGSVRVRARWDAAGPRGPALSFEVADTGIGLTQQQIGKLFRPFTQGDASTTREFGGTGLGLAICHRLASILGGDIGVESVPGQGSSFTLTLATGPLEGTAMVEGPPKPGVQAPAAPPEARPKLACRVLLVDDSPDNQLLISTLLRKAGATVTVVENGRLAVDEALAAETAGTPFDVVLMDMQMPVLDGYGAARLLRGASYPRPIVALTGHAMAGDRETCLAAGCDDYLTKPVKRASLVAMVAKHLAGRDAAVSQHRHRVDVQDHPHVSVHPSA